jgi:hypothetical protein
MDRNSEKKTGKETQYETELEYVSIYVAWELKQIAKYRSRAKEETLKPFNRFLYGDESEENYSELSDL